MFRPPSGDAPRASANADAWFGPGRFSIFLGLLIVTAFPDVVFGGRTFFYRDFGIFGYPLAFHLRESFWLGEIPLWNPLNNCGLPFLAQWNTMVLYPLSLFYVLLPLSWSLGLFCLIHLFLAGLGMYFLARHWTVNRLAACVAGLAFAFNGLTLSCLKWPNNIAALAWMPWLVWLAQLGWRTGGRTLVLAAVVGGLQMLTGGPEIILFTWLVAAALWLVDFFPNRLTQGQALHSTPAPNRGILLPMFRFIGVVVLVAGLTAAQLFPFLDLLAHSQRDAVFSDASWSMPRWGWANFLVPLFHCFPSHQGVFAQYGQYWVSSYYAGIGTLALALTTLWRTREKIVWLLASLAIVSLMLALGSDGYLYAGLRKIVPPLQIVRFPVKFVVLADFVWPVLAAFAVARLQSRPRPDDVNTQQSISAATPQAGSTDRFPRFMMPAAMLGGIFVALIGLILWIAKTNPFPTDNWNATLQSALSRVVFLVLILATAVAAARATLAKARVTFGLGLLLLLWLDVMSHAPRLNPTIDRWVYEPGLAKAELKFNPEPKVGETRVLVSPFAEFRLNHLALTNAVDDYLYSRMSLFANANLLEKLPKVDGFFSLYVREESQVRSLLYASTNTTLPRLAAFLGVSQMTAPGKMIEWTAQPGHLPFATAGQKEIFADGPTTLRGLAEADFDPARMVYLPVEAQAQATATNSATAKVTITRFAAHQIEVQVESSQSVWLVLAQTYYHPWHAWVDGQATKLWRANHAFQAVAVPAGNRTVQLVYRDPAFRLGAAVSVLSGLICAGLWFWPGQRGGTTR